MKALVIDDEQPSIDIMKLMLVKDGRLEIAGAFSNPAEALACLPQLKPDVVFLDVNMPIINGLELGERINELDEDIELVYVTAYDQYALEAFRLNAIDYILKPYTPEHLGRTINRLFKRRGLTGIAASQQTPPLSAPSPVDFPRICSLGGFKVIGQNSPGVPAKWRTAKTEELMAYLYLNKNKSIPKWELMDAIWPNSPAEQAHSHLHTTLYKIRKTLRELMIDAPITFKNGCYYMEIRQPLACDLEQFEQFAQADEPLIERNLPTYLHILSMYEGDLYKGLDYSWCLPAREYYRELFTRMSGRLLDYLMASGDYTSAEAYIHKAQSKVGWDEKIHETQLRIYFLRKDRVSLVRHYHKMTEQLYHELGLEPQESTRQQYLHMLEQLKNV
ncbi:response regulator [Paenibacillus filicis]|uniref:Response regulator n=1 Tax=Paenibacillus filicis TaxID=669464 RepID=A0ABU9DIP3_9BACL